MTHGREKEVRIGWREWVVALLSVVFLIAGAVWAGRGAFRSMLSRMVGRPNERPSRLEGIVGAGTAATGAIPMRLLLPDPWVIVLVAAGVGILGSGFPAYLLAKRRAREETRAA